MLAKIEPSVQVYALAAKFRLKEQNDHIKCLLNQQTERSWPDSGAAQGPTFLLRTSFPIVTTINSLNSGDPPLWFSSRSQCNAVKNCF